MAMNREQKRLLKRQGEITDEGLPTKGRRPARNAPGTEQRTGPRQFAREVRGELRKVAWPTRAETLNYSLVVLVTLVLMIGFIFGVDWVFSNLILRLFEVS
jgi:preprotein translocase subunit SecE